MSISFEVSPNPATDKINLHLHGHSDGAQLYIHDQLGRKVWCNNWKNPKAPAAESWPGKWALRGIPDFEWRNHLEATGD